MGYVGSEIISLNIANLGKYFESKKREEAAK
jgi:hypothetical protein